MVYCIITKSTIEVLRGNMVQDFSTAPPPEDLQLYDAQHKLDMYMKLK